MSDNLINVFIGRRIKALRKRAGLSQSQLAEAIGVTYQQVQKYEKGSTALTVERLYQIAEALSVSPLDFLPDVAELRKIQEQGMGYGYEDELISLFNRLPGPEIKKAVLTLLRSLVKPKK